MKKYLKFFAQCVAILVIAKIVLMLFSCFLSL